MGQNKQSQYAQGENSEISRKPFIILFALLINNIICIMKLVKPGYFCCNLHLWQQGHLLQQKKNNIDKMHFDTVETCIDFRIK